MIINTTTTDKIIKCVFVVRHTTYSTLHKPRLLHRQNASGNHVVQNIHIFNVKHIRVLKNTAWTRKRTQNQSKTPKWTKQTNLPQRIKNCIQQRQTETMISQIICKLKNWGMITSVSTAWR